MRDVVRHSTNKLSEESDVLEMWMTDRSGSADGGVKTAVATESAFEATDAGVWRYGYDLTGSLATNLFFGREIGDGKGGIGDVIRHWTNRLMMRVEKGRS